MAYDSGESPEKKARSLAANKSVSPSQLYGYGMTENEIMEEIQRLELQDYKTKRDTTFTTDAEPWKAAKGASLAAIGGLLGGIFLAPVTGGASVPLGIAAGTALGAGGGLAVDAITNIPIDVAGAADDKAYLGTLSEEKKVVLAKIGDLKLMLSRIRDRKEQQEALAASFKNVNL